MDYAQLLNEVKMRSDDEVKIIASNMELIFPKQKLEHFGHCLMKFLSIGSLLVFLKRLSIKSEELLVIKKPKSYSKSI